MIKKNILPKLPEEWELEEYAIKIQDVPAIPVSRDEMDKFLMEKKKHPGTLAYFHTFQDLMGKEWIINVSKIKYITLMD